MNLRWLFGNFTDPQHSLPRMEQHRLSNLAHKRHVTWSKFLLHAAVILAPMLLAFVLLDPFLTRLGWGNSSLIFIAAIAGLILIFWPWSAWMYRSLYIVPVRKVMREEGHNICLGCGYELRGLPPEVVQCPECGTVRVFEIRDDTPQPTKLSGH